ncbi:MAG: lasso RiPP family leader peptide-containing protein [Actinomycetota bacterium]
MGMEDDRRDRRVDPGVPRAAYERPRLRVLGTVQDLTRMPNASGSKKETHPQNPGSRLI